MNCVKVVGYARVSTEEQNLAQQATHIKDFCIRNSLQLQEIVADEESGRKSVMLRANFKALLERSLKPDFPGEAIIVARLDRLTRNWDDVTFIEKHFRENWGKCRLLSIAEPVELATAAGRVMFRVQMAMNCFEPELIRERSAIGIARAKAEGKYKGGKKGTHWGKRKVNGGAVVVPAGVGGFLP
jgi:putative DNA-invertase from lambdoid prophage Rac